jgi:general secretion pathway protein L
MNLHTTINFDLKRFWVWWIDELSFFIPKKIKSMLVDQSGILVIFENRNNFDLKFYKKNDHSAFLKTSIKSDGNEDFDVLKEKYPYLDKSKIVLVLNDDITIRKVINLPLAAYDNLQQVIGFELNRYTPFTTEQAYFSAIPIGKTDYGQIKVFLVLTPKQCLDNLMQKLIHLQIFPDKVDCDNANHNKQDYDLLPDKYRPIEDNYKKNIRRMTSFIMVALLLAVLVVPVWRLDNTVDVLGGKIKLFEKQFNKVIQQQHEIQELYNQTDALIKVKTNVPIVIAILKELSHLLHDDTWLINLQFGGNKLQIQGVSPNASALIGLLEASDVFTNVMFVSPITQDKNSGKERFQISLDIGKDTEKLDEKGVVINE